MSNNNEVEELTKELELINNTSSEFSEEDKEKILNKGFFDKKLFNLKADEVIKLNIKKRNLKDKLRLAKLKKYFNSGNKKDMINNIILNKNYIRLFIMLLLLLFTLLTYLIYNINI